MGNRFTAHGSSAERDELKLSNGGTDVFFDVLTLAGCDLAETAWEQNLVLYFADGHRLGFGTAGFDLSVSVITLFPRGVDQVIPQVLAVFLFYFPLVFPVGATRPGLLFGR